MEKLGGRAAAGAQGAAEPGAEVSRGCTEWARSGRGVGAGWAEGLGLPRRHCRGEGGFGAEAGISPLGTREMTPDPVEESPWELRQ